VNSPTNDKKSSGLDVLLLVLILLLTTIGIVMVFDSSYPYLLAHHMSVTKYVVLQSIYGAIGIVLLIGCSRIGYWRWRNVATSAMLFSVIMLVGVYVPHLGIMENGAHRWLGYRSFRMQPSEFAKFAVVLYVARSCAGNPRIMKHFLIGPGPGVVAIGLIALLIAKEPDLGTAILIAATGFAMLFFAGMKVRHLAFVTACLAVVLSIFFLTKPGHGQSGYQVSRIKVFLHPEQDNLGDGFQVYRSMLALGTGGLTGEGIGSGREKLNLPEAYTDFIFAVVGEEGGFVATFAILLLYCLIVARGMQIACSTRDRFGALMAAGTSFSLGIQAFVNIGAVTATLPATGVPLPGISYGGTSLMLTLLMTGILLNIGRFPDGNPALLKDAKTAKAEREYNKRFHGADNFKDYPGDRSASRRATRPITRTAY
jgi:cell division protein FtsW